MIELWGIRKEADWTTVTEVRELVATFDTAELAHIYVKNSLLSVANDKMYFSADPYRGKFKYRKESLLRWYVDYEIEGADKSIPPPHNPTLETK